MGYRGLPATHSEHSGSNGIAIAPARSANGHALLLINPHTSFYNRSEQHVTSDHGLNVYGAATWGQFFIYQGFNTHAGWMHTSNCGCRYAMFPEASAKMVLFEEFACSRATFKKDS